VVAVMVVLAVLAAVQVVAVQTMMMMMTSSLVLGDGRRPCVSHLRQAVVVVGRRRSS